MPDDLFVSALERIFIKMPGRPLAIAALSGGMDSVVLLHLLARHRARLPGNCRLVAAHLNHGLRGEDADGDQEFCRDLCRQLGIEFATRDVDASRTARIENLGVEEAGRLLRYRFFHELGGSGALAFTGHHADDQAETILMNLRRGAHRRGLSGMRELSVLPVPPGLKVAVARPLLTADRELLRDYAVRHRLRWREDATNADAAFTRNRIRHRIIPALEKIMPGFRKRLLERAQLLAREEEEMATRGRLLAESLSRREHGGRVFRLSEVAFAEPERLIYAFRHVVEEEMGARLPYGAVLSRLSQLAESGRLGETLSLPSRLRVRKERDGLFFFFPEKGGADSYGEFILPDPPFVVRAYGMTVRAEWRNAAGKPPAEDMADPEVEWMNPAGIRWPLRLRVPLPGERFRPMNAPGGRKIQDILVDLKTSRRERETPRLLADHVGGIWLWPFRLGHRVRLTGEATRALRVEIRP